MEGISWVNTIIYIKVSLSVAGILSRTTETKEMNAAIVVMITVSLLISSPSSPVGIPNIDQFKKAIVNKGNKMVRIPTVGCLNKVIVK